MRPCVRRCASSERRLAPSLTAVLTQLLTRLEGKSRELVRLQAAWRGALARGAHKKQCEERMRRIKEELTADGQDGGASLVVRVQARRTRPCRVVSTHVLT